MIVNENNKDDFIKRERTKNDIIVDYIFDKRKSYYKHMVRFMTCSFLAWITIITLLICGFFTLGNILFLGISDLFISAIIIFIIWLVFFIVYAIYLRNLSKRELKHPIFDKTN